MKIKDPETTPDFGKRLLELRKKLNLKQSDLAKQLNMSRETVSYYETRCQNPTAEIVKKLADFFSVDPAELISEPTSERIRKGPKSKLEKQLDAIKKLPKEKQKAIMVMIDMALESEQKTK